MTAKSSPLLGLALLAIGVAVGWFSRGLVEKPETAHTEVAQQNPAHTTSLPATPSVEGDEPQPSTRGKRAIREPKSESGPKTGDAKAAEIAEGQMRKMMESMAQRQRTRMDQHLDRLHASLSLTPEQRAQLTAWLDERTSNLAELDMSALSGPSDIKDANAGLSPEGMEAYLGALLSPSQKTALEEFQQRDRQSKVDALALKNLSQIQAVVDFTDDQRDQVYRILSKAAESKLNAAPEDGDPMSFMHESMGIEVDPYDLGLNTILQGIVAGPKGEEESAGASGKRDKETIVESAREELERRINQKVDMLAPVLNQKQLEQYRTELRTRGGGLVEQTLMGIDLWLDESDDTAPEIAK